MSTSRPPKSNLFQSTRVPAIDTQKAEADLPLNIEEEKEQSVIQDEKDHLLFTQSVFSSALPAQQILVAYLEQLKSTERNRNANEIIKELSGVSAHLKENRDKLVVSEIIKSVLPFLNNVLKEHYQSVGRYPGRPFSQLKLLPTILPDFLDKIKFRAQDENKESGPSLLPSSRPRT